MRIILKRFISVAVCFAFVSAEAAQAQAAGGGVALPPPASSVVFADHKPFPSDLTTARLPVSNVSVQSLHAGASGTTILHIQDAHSNLSGQQSLAAALDELMDRYDVRLVLVEGGSGDVTLDGLKSIGTRGQWERAAKRLLYEGWIAGEEYLNLTTDHPMRLVGIEEPALYRQSLKVYETIVRHRKHTLPYLRRISLALDRVKNKLYPKVLLDYEAAVLTPSDREDGSGENPDFAVRTERLIALARSSGTSLDDFESVASLERLKTAEKRIDFARAQAEEELLISAVYPDRGSDAFKRYVEARRKAQASPVAQLAMLQDLVERSGRGRESLMMLGAYLKYLEDFSRLDMSALLIQMERLEDLMYRNLLKDDEDARMLRACDRFLGLLQRAYRIRMSSDEFGMLKVNESDFPTKLLLGFLNRQLAELGYLEDLTPYESALEDARYAIELFYRLVGKRDRAFMANAERALADSGVKTAVLITGGYHTAHLEQLMRREDWSYAVLTPMVEYETDQAKYESLLLSPLKVRRPLVVEKSVERPSVQGKDKARDGLRVQVAAARLAQGTDSEMARKIGQYLGIHDPAVVSQALMARNHRTDLETPEASKEVRGARLGAKGDGWIPRIKRKWYSFTRTFKIVLGTWLGLHAVSLAAAPVLEEYRAPLIILSGIGAVVLAYPLARKWVRSRSAILTGSDMRRRLMRTNKTFAYIIFSQVLVLAAVKQGAASREFVDTEITSRIPESWGVFLRGLLRDVEQKGYEDVLGAAAAGDLMPTPLRSEDISWVPKDSIPIVAPGALNSTASTPQTEPISALPALNEAPVPQLPVQDLLTGPVSPSTGLPTPENVERFMTMLQQQIDASKGAAAGKDRLGKREIEQLQLLKKHFSLCVEVWRYRVRVLSVAYPNPTDEQRVMINRAGLEAAKSFGSILADENLHLKGSQEGKELGKGGHGPLQIEIPTAKDALDRGIAALGKLDDPSREGLQELWGYWKTHAKGSYTAADGRKVERRVFNDAGELVDTTALAASLAYGPVEWHAFMVDLISLAKTGRLIPGGSRETARFDAVYWNTSAALTLQYLADGIKRPRRRNGGAIPSEIEIAHRIYGRVMELIPAEITAGNASEAAALWREANTAFERSREVHETYTGIINEIRRDKNPGGEAPALRVQLNDLEHFGDLQDAVDRSLSETKRYIDAFLKSGKRYADVVSGARLAFSRREASTRPYWNGDTLVLYPAYQDRLPGSFEGELRDTLTLIERDFLGTAQASPGSDTNPSRRFLREIFEAIFQDIAAAQENGSWDEGIAFRASDLMARAAWAMADGGERFEDWNPVRFLEVTREVHMILKQITIAFQTSQNVGMGIVKAGPRSRLKGLAGRVSKWFLPREIGRRAALRRLYDTASSMHDPSPEDPRSTLLALMGLLPQAEGPGDVGSVARALRQPIYREEAERFLSDSGLFGPMDGLKLERALEICSRIRVSGEWDAVSPVREYYVEAPRMLRADPAKSQAAVQQLRAFVQRIRYQAPKRDKAHTEDGSLFYTAPNGQTVPLELFDAGGYNDLFLLDKVPALPREIQGQYLIRIQRADSRDLFWNHLDLAKNLEELSERNLVPEVLYAGILPDGRGFQILKRMDEAYSRANLGPDLRQALLELVASAVEAGIAVDDFQPKNVMAAYGPPEGIAVAFTDADGAYFHGGRPAAKILAALEYRRQLLDKDDYNQWTDAHARYVSKPLLDMLDRMIAIYKIQLIDRSLAVLTARDQHASGLAGRAGWRPVPQESDTGWTSALDHVLKEQEPGELPDAGPGSERAAERSARRLLTERSKWVSALKASAGPAGPASTAAYTASATAWNRSPLDDLIRDWESGRDLGSNEPVIPSGLLSAGSGVIVFTLTLAGILGYEKWMFAEMALMFTAALIFGGKWMTRKARLTLGAFAALDSILAVTTGFDAGGQPLTLSGVLYAAGLAAATAAGVRWYSRHRKTVLGARLSDATPMVTFENRLRTGIDVVMRALRSGDRVLVVGTGVYPYFSTELADAAPRHQITAVDLVLPSATLQPGADLKRKLFNAPEPGAWSTRVDYSDVWRYLGMAPTAETPIRVIFDQQGRPVNIEIAGSHVYDKAMEEALAGRPDLMEKYLAFKKELSAAYFTRPGLERSGQLTRVDTDQLDMFEDMNGNQWIDSPHRSRYFSRRNLTYLQADVLDPEAPIGMEGRSVKGTFGVIEISNVLVYFTARQKQQAMDRFASLLREGGRLIIGRSSNDHFVVSEADGERSAEYTTWVKKKGRLVPESFTFNTAAKAFEAMDAPGALEKTLVGGRAFNSLFEQYLGQAREGSAGDGDRGPLPTVSGMYGAYREAVQRAAEDRGRNVSVVDRIDRLLKTHRFYPRVVKELKKQGFRARVETRPVPVSIFGKQWRAPWSKRAVAITIEFDEKRFPPDDAQRMIGTDAPELSIKGDEIPDTQPVMDFGELFAGWQVSRIRNVKAEFEAGDPARVYEVQLTGQSGAARTVFIKTVDAIDAASSIPHREARSMIEREAGIHRELAQSAALSDNHLPLYQRALEVMPEYLAWGRIEADEVIRVQGVGSGATADVAHPDDGSIHLKPGAYVLVTEGISDDSMKDKLAAWEDLARESAGDESAQAVLRSEVELTFDRLVQTVYHLHQAGMFNRDLTSRDMFVGERGVRVGDWGAAVKKGSLWYGLTAIRAEMYPDNDENDPMFAVANPWNYPINRSGLTADGGVGQLIASDLMSIASMYREALLLTGRPVEAFGNDPGTNILHRYVDQAPAEGRAALEGLLRPYREDLTGASFGSFRASALLLQAWTRASRQDWHGYVVKFPHYFGDFAWVRSDRPELDDETAVVAELTVPFDGDAGPEKEIESIVALIREAAPAVGARLSKMIRGLVWWVLQAGVMVAAFYATHQWVNHKLDRSQPASPVALERVEMVSEHGPEGVRSLQNIQRSVPDGQAEQETLLSEVRLLTTEIRNTVTHLNRRLMRQEPATESELDDLATLVTAFVNANNRLDDPEDDLVVAEYLRLRDQQDLFETAQKLERLISGYPRGFFDGGTEDIDAYNAYTELFDRYTSLSDKVRTSDSQRQQKKYAHYLALNEHVYHYDGQWPEEHGSGISGSGEHIDDPPSQVRQDYEAIIAVRTMAPRDIRNAIDLRKKIGELRDQALSAVLMDEEVMGPDDLDDLEGMHEGLTSRLGSLGADEARGLLFGLEHEWAGESAPVSSVDVLIDLSDEGIITGPLIGEAEMDLNDIDLIFAVWERIDRQVIRYSQTDSWGNARIDLDKAQKIARILSQSLTLSPAQINMLISGVSAQLGDKPVFGSDGKGLMTTHPAAARLLDLWMFGFLGKEMPFSIPGLALNRDEHGVPSSNRFVLPERLMSAPWTYVMMRQIEHVGMTPPPAIWPEPDSKDPADRFAFNTDYLKWLEKYVRGSLGMNADEPLMIVECHFDSADREALDVFDRLKPVGGRGILNLYNVESGKFSPKTVGVFLESLGLRVAIKKVPENVPELASGTMAILNDRQTVWATQAFTWKEGRLLKQTHSHGKYGVLPRIVLVPRIHFSVAGSTGFDASVEPALAASTKLKGGDLSKAAGLARSIWWSQNQDVGVPEPDNRVPDYNLKRVRTWADSLRESAKKVPGSGPVIDGIDRRLQYLALFDGYRQWLAAQGEGLALTKDEVVHLAEIMDWIAQVESGYQSKYIQHRPGIKSVGALQTDQASLKDILDHLSRLGDEGRSFVEFLRSQGIYDGIAAGAKDHAVFVEAMTDSDLRDDASIALLKLMRGADIAAHRGLVDFRIEQDSLTRAVQQHAVELYQRVYNTSFEAELDRFLTLKREGRTAAEALSQAQNEFTQLPVNGLSLSAKVRAARTLTRGHFVSLLQAADGDADPEAFLRDQVVLTEKMSDDLDGFGPLTEILIKIHETHLMIRKKGGYTPSLQRPISANVDEVSEAVGRAYVALGKISPDLRDLAEDALFDADEWVTVMRALTDPKPQHDTLPGALVAKTDGARMAASKNALEANPVRRYLYQISGVLRDRGFEKPFVVYPASGADITSALTATNAGEVVMIDRSPMGEDGAVLPQRDAYQYRRMKREDGWAVGLDMRDGIKPYADLELSMVSDYGGDAENVQWGEAASVDGRYAVRTLTFDWRHPDDDAPVRRVIRFVTVPEGIEAALDEGSDTVFRRIISPTREGSTGSLVFMKAGEYETYLRRRVHDLDNEDGWLTPGIEDEFRVARDLVRSFGNRLRGVVADVPLSFKDEANIVNDPRLNKVAPGAVFGYGRKDTGNTADHRPPQAFVYTLAANEESSEETGQADASAARLADLYELGTWVKRPSASAAVSERPGPPVASERLTALVPLIERTRTSSDPQAVYPLADRTAAGVSFFNIYGHKVVDAEGRSVAGPSQAGAQSLSEAGREVRSSVSPTETQRSIAVDRARATVPMAQLQRKLASMVRHAVTSNGDQRILAVLDRSFESNPAYADLVAKFNADQASEARFFIRAVFGDIETLRATEVGAGQEYTGKFFIGADSTLGRLADLEDVSGVEGAGSVAVKSGAGVFNLPMTLMFEALLQARVRSSGDSEMSDADLHKFTEDAQLLLRAVFGSELLKVQVIRSMGQPGTADDLRVIVQYPVNSDLKPADLDAYTLALTAALTSA